MKVTIELTTEEEIKTFYERMFMPDKPNITMYAAPAPEADPLQKELPERFMPASDKAPFEEDDKSAPGSEQVTISYETVQNAAIKLVQAQKQEALRALLQKHGLQALPELKNAPEKMAAFYKDMEVI